MQSTATAIRQITRAYQLHLTQYGLPDNATVRISALTDQLDLTPEEITAGMSELFASRRINLAPAMNQKTLTRADRDHAVWVGGEDKHDITFN